MPSWKDIPIMALLPNRRHDKRFDTWYSNLKMEQLEELCKATKLPYSGTKMDLVSRLSNHTVGSRFAWERSSYHATDGLTNAQLKEMCVERSIPKSGNRYAMVHRLLEHSGKASADAATAVDNKKRARLGDVTAAPAAKKPRPDDHYQALYDTIQRKISTTTKRYFSHLGFKSHSDYVYQLVADTLEENINREDPKKDLAVAKAIFTCLTDNFKSIVSPGYDHRDNLGYSMKLLRRVVRTANDCASLDNEEKVDLFNWLDTLHDTIALYIDFLAEEMLVDLKSDLEDEIDGLEDEIEEDSEEEEDDDKPSDKPFVSFPQAMKENEIPTTKHANTENKVGSFWTNENQDLAPTKEHQKPAPDIRGSTVTKARPLQQHVPIKRSRQLPSIV